MTLRWLQGKLEQPFVRQGTVQDMTSVARKFAMVRSATQEIARAEKVMMSQDDGSREWKMAGRDMLEAAKKGQEWCRDMISILNGIKRNSESYLRGL
jgi:hypothetical protein